MSIKGGAPRQEYLSLLGLTGVTDLTIGTTAITLGDTVTTSAWETSLSSGPDFSVDLTTGLFTLPAGKYIVNIFCNMKTLSDERFVQLTFWRDSTQLLEGMCAMPYLDSGNSYGNISMNTIMQLNGSDLYSIKIDNGSQGVSTIFLSGGSPATCGASFYKID